MWHVATNWLNSSAVCHHGQSWCFFTKNGTKPLFRSQPNGKKPWPKTVFLPTQNNTKPWPKPVFSSPPNGKKPCLELLFRSPTNRINPWPKPVFFHTLFYISSDVILFISSIQVTNFFLFLIDLLDLINQIIAFVMTYLGWVINIVNKLWWSVQFIGIQVVHHKLSLSMLASVFKRSE